MINCKNCGNNFKGKYCNLCGEKMYTENDKTIFHFVEQGLHFITHFEGTLFTTLKTIFLKPGKLSIDYCNGIRKKYFKPIPLFLLLVVLYLLFPFFEGLNMQLKYYPQQDLYGNYATNKINQKLQQTGYTTQVLAEKFHTKSEKISKFLLLSLIPFTAIFFYGISFFKRKYFFDSMVLSAEINSFYLLYGFFATPLLLTIASFIATKIFGASHFNISEEVLGLIVYIPTCLFVFIAAKKFYQFKIWQSLLFVLAFFVAHAFIVYSLYKFLLFFYNHTFGTLMF